MTPLSNIHLGAGVLLLDALDCVVAEIAPVVWTGWFAIVKDSDRVTLCCLVDDFPTAVAAVRFEDVLGFLPPEREL